MIIVDYNINLYEEMQQMKDTVADLQSYVEKLEKMIVIVEEKEELNIDKDCSKFWTIDDIIKKYSISVTTVGKWKKLLHLKTTGKQGKKIRYKKKNVEVWYKKIELLKISNPEIFEVKFRKFS